MSVLNLIGNTPLVDISSLQSNPNIKIYGKLEGQNPGGSVKDRAAFNMIKEAIDAKLIKAGDKIIEATSGNTGIALAMIAQQFSLKVTLVMPENASQERIQTMKAFGAEVILTPSEKTIEFSRSLAIDKSKNEGYFILNQFDNPNNYLAHVKTTGPEIWKDTNEQITHFVSSMGTTGTIMGVSTYLKSVNPEIKIVGVQPKEGSRIPGIRRWTSDFLPAIYDANKVDKIIDVSSEEAQSMAIKLSQRMSIFAGMSSGGAVFSALKLAKQVPDGSVLVCIICDRGDRYLSTPMYKNL